MAPEVQAQSPQEQYYKIAMFPKGEMKVAPATLPIIVNAPIVADARTEEGVSGLLTYIKSLTQHNNEEIARVENERLQPYLSAMSVYLTRALEKVKAVGEEGAELEVGRRKQDLALLTTPQALSGLFNAMATFTRTTLISDVVVMSDDIKREGPASHLFKGWSEFNSNYDYCGKSFNFGFLQAFEGGERNKAKSGTTFPTFMVDYEMVRALPEAEKAPLLRDIQGVMTLVNHDMLHHLTSTYIGSNTVFKTDATSDWGTSDAVRVWSRTLPKMTAGEAYEEWAQMGQEKVLLQPAGAPMVADIRGKIDHYMDGLERARDALLAPVAGQEGPASKEQLRKAHEVVDYFGMVMAHALTRVFPLNHDVMQHCLDRLQKADPLPDAAALDCARMMAPNVGLGENPAASEVLGAIRRSTVKHDSWGSDPLINEMVQSYRGLGCDVLPEQDTAVGYKNFKMVQLMKLGGLHAHIPKIENKGLTQLRQNMEDFTLKMVAAVAKTTGYRPA